MHIIYLATALLCGLIAVLHFRSKRFQRSALFAGVGVIQVMLFITPRPRDILSNLPDSTFHLDISNSNKMYLYNECNICGHKNKEVEGRGLFQIMYAHHDLYHRKKKK